jgi:hypothetical protein
MVLQRDDKAEYMMKELTQAQDENFKIKAHAET